MLDDAGRQVRTVSSSPAQGNKPLPGLLRGFSKHGRAQHDLEHDAVDLVICGSIALGIALDQVLGGALSGGLADPVP
ncbi:hypothetical protein ABH935_009855 [Catenulispora sp. GAS73]|uniref:hypothetical protein n=1 Tax=Catenulispora sp. GAS73 TaxID=3156269 RepID=UPI0035169DBC